MDVKARTCERDAGERVEREIKRDRESRIGARGGERTREREKKREKKIECNGRRQAGWGKRPGLPRRPATNCRRPRLRAARYSRRSARGGRGRLGPQNSAAQNAQPAPEFSARCRRVYALSIRALSFRVTGA